MVVDHSLGFFCLFGVGFFGGGVGSGVFKLYTHLVSICSTF